MKINNIDIENRTQPYLIAEIGVNYFDIAEQRGISPIAAAKEMVREAATAGVDAVKFQSYSADQLASKNSPAYWDTSEESTESQYELFAQYDDFGEAEFEEIATWTAENHDVDFLSTPFDFHAVEYLEDLVPAYKIASADITNHPLLRQIAQKEKPVYCRQERARLVRLTKQYASSKTKLRIQKYAYSTAFSSILPIRRMPILV